MKHTRRSAIFCASIAIGALTAATFCAPAIAQTALPSQAATATPTFEDWLIRADQIKVQDDASALYRAAWNYAATGEHDKAIALFRRALLIPAAPGAQRPSIFGGPTDYRGSARWGIAESLRAQGKWSEALAMYRLNREVSPLDDGCVGSGEAFQKMAIGEGICLENLGRHGEAVELYWTAATNLYLGTPTAMRHLTDLYAASGQISVLDAAIERERQPFLEDARLSASGRATGELNAEEQQSFERLSSESPFMFMEKVHQFRKAARANNWQPLVETLQTKSSQGSGLEGLLLVEVFETLKLAPVQASAALKIALKSAPEDLQLQAALLYSQADAKQRAELLERSPRSEAEDVLHSLVLRDSPSADFPEIPKNLILPDPLQNLRDN